MSATILSVAPITIRKIFNREYLPRIEKGELKQAVVKEHHPSAPLAKEPFCTKSQMLEIRERDGRLLALVHRYLRPDGTIGLSGKPDPKKLLYQGIQYRLRIPQ